LFITASIILLFSCTTTTQPELAGVWIDSSDAKFEFIEGGSLICHSKFDPTPTENIREELGISSDAIIISPEVDMKINGNWEMLDDSTIIMSLDLSNETLSLTNKIQIISDDRIVLSREDYSSEFNRLN
jgi:hypothetical protein